MIELGLVRGYVLERADVNIGRLCRVKTGDVYSFDFDSAENIATFIVPSTESQRGKVYAIQVDVRTGEAICPCAHFGTRLRAFPEKMRPGPDRYKNWEERLRYLKLYATDFERRAWQEHHRYSLPSVNRRPSGLCRHLICVRSWLRRHGAMSDIETNQERILPLLAA